MGNDDFLDGYNDFDNDSSSPSSYGSYNSYNGGRLTDDDYEFFEGFDSYGASESNQSHESDEDYYESPEETFLDQLVARTGFDSREDLMSAWDDNQAEEDFYEGIQSEVDWLMSQNVDFDTAIELIQNRLEQEAFEESQREEQDILQLFDTILEETGKPYNGEQLDPIIFDIVKRFDCTLSEAYMAHRNLTNPFVQGMNSI